LAGTKIFSSLPAATTERPRCSHLNMTNSKKIVYTYRMNSPPAADNPNIKNFIFD